MADDSCNRCDGTGSVTLGDTTVTCPLCGGSGDAAGNSTEENSGLDAFLTHLAANPVDVESRLKAFCELRDKYTSDDRDAMAKAGEAMSDGSYPIKDEEDLKNAIHAVGRGGADHNAIRKHIMGRAKVLELSNLIPENWNSDGSLQDDEAKARIAARAIRGEYRNIRETRVSPRSEFEIREVADGTGGTNLRFTGFASVTGDDATYEMEDWQGPWTESVSVGAFTKTLSEGADVAFLINHEGMTLARTKPGTLKLSEETDARRSPIPGVTGLHAEALLDPQNMYVQAARSAVERGDLDEMSFAFRVTRQEWSADWDRRWLNEVNMDKGDTSLVNYGANPITGGTVAIRQRPFGLRDHSEDEMPAGRLLHLVKNLRIFGATYEIREGKVLSGSNQTQLQTALDALHSTDDTDIPGIVRALQAIDSALDVGQAALAAVLQTADPDGDLDDLEPALEPPRSYDFSRDRLALAARRIS